MKQPFDPTPSSHYTPPISPDVPRVSMQTRLSLPMQIRIRGYTFTISAPYDAGCVLDLGAAQALNGLRAENIQNNIRDNIAQTVDALPPGELLTPEQIRLFQDEITRYDERYKFKERGESKARLGDLEEAARIVARERVEVNCREQGLELSESEIEEMILQYSVLPAVMEEARSRVQAKRKVLAGSLSDL